MEYEDSESLIRIKIGFIFKKLQPVENRQWGVWMIVILYVIYCITYILTYTSTVQNTYYIHIW